MKSLFRVAGIIAATALIQGCSTYAIPRYSSSAETLAALRKVGGSKVNVGKFTATTTKGGEITCRAVGPIKTPDGETFEDYVRKAVMSELIVADLYDERSDLTLTGVLERIDFDSMNGAWDLGLTLQSTNGRSVKAAERYSFVSSAYGETGCNQTAQAAMGAVQNLITTAVRSPDFKTLVAK